MGAKIIKKLSIGKPPRFFLSPESPKQSAHQACLRNSIIHTSEAEMHRALPPPFFEIKKCVYRYDFIVTARRGNNIFAILSSPRSAGTIFLLFYRHRAARERYFCISVLAVLLQIHSRTVLAFAGQLRAFRNVARTAREWRRASCRGENEKQSSEIE